MKKYFFLFAVLFLIGIRSNAQTAGAQPAKPPVSKGVFIKAQPFTAPAVAPAYSLVINGGYLIDPKNNISGIMDIAIQDGKIAKVAKTIDPKLGLQSVNARGMYVSPGLIDIFGHLTAPPDVHSFKTGVTTIVEAGSVTWKSFPDFKKNIIDKSQTRVFTFLTMDGTGYKGGAYEQNSGDNEAKMAADLARANRQYIVGFEVNFAGPDWTPVDRGVEAGNQANMPIMLDGGRNHPQPSLEDLFMKHMRPGDIYTHTYTILEDVSARGTIVDLKTDKLYPFVPEAQKKGIIFDVGHGSAFRFSQAIPSLKAGFYPNTISTDGSLGNMNAYMKDQLNIMSKLMAIGMTLPGVIKASTWAAAQAIKHEELGQLSVGSIADIAIFTLRKGKFGFFETAGDKMESDQKLECEMTIKGGRIVHDLNGIVKPLNIRVRPPINQ